MIDNEHFVITTRLVARRTTPLRPTPCVLCDEHGAVMSSHPTMESACAEARRIHAYRAHRKLPAIATQIVMVKR